MFIDNYLLLFKVLITKQTSVLVFLNILEDIPWLTLECFADTFKR